ncbi:MAG TPA: 6-bladed beta-propeller [Terriglobia bacterium]|nr:6-bladed beta-propeller [Terriglobia bacterium]
MFTHRFHSKLVKRTKGRLAFVLALAVAGLPALAKNKKAAVAPESPEQKRITLDITKIVWPNPPAIARIRFMDILSGEKIDWAALKEPQKRKASWMDRLAGAQPDAQVQNIQSKMTFQLIRTYGVAVDSEGYIYAADQGVGAIFIFNLNTKEVRLIKNGQDAHFELINGLAIDDDDRLFVTDSKLHHVLVFNGQHQQVAVFGTGDLISPGGIAIDTENRFAYVVDTQADQVLVYDADKFKLLRRIGAGGKKHTLTDPGNFSLPTHVAVDKEGNVYVTDTLNNRVEIFDADGQFISEFGQSGDGPGRFARPKGIAIDSDGHIWVVDELQSRVQVFDKGGRLLIYLGQSGLYPGQFRAAYAIAADRRNNRIITSEQWPGRLQVFRYVTDAEAAAEKDRREAEQAKPRANAADSPTRKGGEPVKEQTSPLSQAQKGSALP